MSLKHGVSPLTGHERRCKDHFIERGKRKRKAKEDYWAGHEKDIHHEVEKACSKAHEGKLIGHFFALSAPWLKTKINGKWYTDEELASIGT